jgi:hypothetical protein
MPPVSFSHFKSQYLKDLPKQPMKKALLSFAFALMLNALSAQQISNATTAECDVQVAFAISEGDGFGEYSMTRLITLHPGDQFNFRNEAFESRRIYSKVQDDEIFIVRFVESGITHFINARIGDGYESTLNGGCTLDHRPFLKRRDGVLVLDASAN